MVYQLTRNLKKEQLKTHGFDAYFVDHTTGVYPAAAGGYPHTSASIMVKGDPITDLHENLAADAAARKNKLPACGEAQGEKTAEIVKEKI